MKKIPDPGKFSVSPLYKRASVKLMHMGNFPLQAFFTSFRLLENCKKSACEGTQAVLAIRYPDFFWQC